MPAKVKPRTSPAEIADRISQLIERGEFKPGDRLREVAMAERFAVGRAPVREALRLLEAKSLIKVEHRRGARVMQLDDEELIDAIRIRAALLALAIELAAGKATEAERGRIDELAARLAASARAETSARAFTEEVFALVNAILDAARSAKLAATLRSFHHSGPRYFDPLALATRHRRMLSAKAWRRIADALIAGDSEKAATLSRRSSDESLAATLDVKGTADGLFLPGPTPA
jgi:DNA-binding GntR family transcriptional regulator